MIGNTAPYYRDRSQSSKSDGCEKSNSASPKSQSEATATPEVLMNRHQRCTEILCQKIDSTRPARIGDQQSSEN
jgi:hypothetical protein